MYSSFITYNSRDYYDIFIPDDAEIVFTEQEDELFFRRNLDGELIAHEATYKIIDFAPFNAEFLFTMQKQDQNGNYKDYFKGKFYKRDCKFYEDQQYVEFKVETLDKYTPFLEGLNIEFNMLQGDDLPIKKDITFEGVSHIQVAMLDWINNNDSIDNKWKKITNSNIITGPSIPYARHFCKIKPDSSWTKVKGGYAFEINTSDPNVSDIFDGIELRSESSLSEPEKLTRHKIPHVYKFGYGGVNGIIDPPGSYPPNSIEWWIPNTYPLYIDATVNYDDCLTFWDVLEKIITDFDSSVTFDKTIEYSEFFFSEINPITNESQDLKFLGMLQKSDALSPDGTPSSNGHITFQNLIEVIKTVFGCNWFIDSNNRFRIEHRDYFDNGGVYFNVNNTGNPDGLKFVDDSQIENVNDIGNDITYTLSGSVHNFTLDSDKIYNDPTFKLGTINYSSDNFANKPFKISFDYRVQNFTTNNNAEFVGLFFCVDGFENGIKIDASVTDYVTFERYFTNVSEFESFSLKLIGSLKPLPRDRIVEDYSVLSGLSIDFRDINIQFYDINRKVGLDFTKYISLKNIRNGLELSNIYEYTVEDAKNRKLFKYQESFNREVAIGEQISPERTLILGDLTCNFNDGNENKWLKNEEETHLVSNFIAQFIDYVTVENANLDGWILLDLDENGAVNYSMFDSYYEQNALLYFHSLITKFISFDNIYDSFDVNGYTNELGNRYKSNSLKKIRVQDEIETIVLNDDIEVINLVKTNLGDGQVYECSINLNSRRLNLKLKYDY